MEKEINLLDNPELKATLEIIRKNTDKLSDPYIKYVYKLAISKEGELMHQAALDSLKSHSIAIVNVDRRKSVYQNLSTNTTTLLVGIISLKNIYGTRLIYGIRDTFPVTVKKLYEDRLNKQP